MPQLREWVREKFGSTDIERILDPDVYSDSDLTRDVVSLERELKKLEDDIDQHGKKYKQLLKKGSEVSEFKREKYITRAQHEKKEFKAKKKLYKDQSQKLGMLLSIQHLRQLKEMQGGDTIVDEMEELPLDELENEIDDMVEDYEVNRRMREQVEQVIDTTFKEEGVDSVGAKTPEEEIMEGLSEDEVSVDDIDIEEGLEASESESDEVDMDDIDVDDIEL